MDGSQPGTSKASEQMRSGENADNSMEGDIQFAQGLLNSINQNQRNMERGLGTFENEPALRNKLSMLQQEEQALLSFLTKLRSHQRTLILEQQRLTSMYEEKAKEEDNSRN